MLVLLLSLILMLILVLISAAGVHISIIAADAKAGVTSCGCLQEILGQ